jgi:hypothetical protein
VRRRDTARAVQLEVRADAEAEGPVSRSAFGSRPSRHRTRATRRGLDAPDARRSTEGASTRMTANVTPVQPHLS